MSALVENTKFEELCRLCGSKTDSLAVHIFEDEGTFSELENKILGCLQLQINQQDELPKLLCDHCLVKLEMFWDFKDRSFRTEQLLIELLKQLKSAENEQCLVSMDNSGMIVQGQDLSNHHLCEPEQNFNLIPQQMLNEVSMVEDGTIYVNDNSYPEPQETTDSLACYSNPNLSENSLNLTEFESRPLLEINNFFKFNDNFETNTDATISFTESHEVKSNGESHEVSLDSSDGLSIQEDSLPKLASPVAEPTENLNLSDRSAILSNATQELPPEERKTAPKAVTGKVCPECGKSYRSNYKLGEHMTKHTGEKKYKCRTCEKRFRSKMGLAQHEAKHTGQYDLRCSVCGKGFQCRSYLMVHQRVHSDEKPFPCTTCGLNFKTKQSLLDHTNRHLGLKPYTCSICNRGFITKSLCLAHEKTHSGVDNRKYSCKICEKRFVSKSYLRTHSRIHTGEKSFICEVCGKGFMTRVDLRIHSTVHTGEKSFVCEMCGKAFARRDALKCHRRMHTGERPYSCDICGRTFTQFTPMANHKRNHHSGSGVVQSSLS